VRTMTAAELEQGAWGLDGRLGDEQGRPDPLAGLLDDDV